MDKFHIQFQNNTQMLGQFFFYFKRAIFRRERIAEAIAEYKTKTCINFRPKNDTDINYVHIFPDDGCYSLVGKVGRYFFFYLKNFL